MPDTQPTDMATFVPRGDIPVVYQEQYPEKARTHRSVAEAFDRNTWAAIERESRLTVAIRSWSLGAPWVLSLLLVAIVLTAPRWWPGA